MGLANTFMFDWTVRIKAAAHVNLFILNGGVVAKADHLIRRFVTHAATRLTCNHSGYAPLWHEQLNRAWQETGKTPFSWPVLAGDEERWQVRAVIDAVVANAYGLSRNQYAHVLSTFKHTSYPEASELCLAMFDELKAIGLDAFTKKHDPYWDVPLNENLPQPVIDLPGLAPAGNEDFALASAQSRKPKRGGKRR